VTSETRGSALEPFVSRANRRLSSDRAMALALRSHAAMSNARDSLPPIPAEGWTPGDLEKTLEQLRSATHRCSSLRRRADRDAPTSRGMPAVVAPPDDSDRATGNRPFEK
jgi:hypothetical protein